MFALAACVAFSVAGVLSWTGGAHVTTLALAGLALLAAQFVALPRR